MRSGGSFSLHKTEDDIVIALVGNPNVGKSTLFNIMTGGKQHTGNWAGKTVEIAQGSYTYKGKTYILVDLPGTYSLTSQSEEEEITSEFIRSNAADCTLIISDGTCLERNLSFALQVMNLTDRVMLCVNLMDEAEEKGIMIDIMELRQQLRIPVVGTSAGKKEGIEGLKEMLRNLSDGFLRSDPVRLEEYCDCRSVGEHAAEAYAHKAAQLSDLCIQGRTVPKRQWADRIFLGPVTGKAVLVALLFAVFWLTISGANQLSSLLEYCFTQFGRLVSAALAFLPAWMKGFLIDGIYVTTSKVIAVMLPPMLIFFSLFSALEDLGYLPRAAFLMDHAFQRCGSCGKQILTMSMGFGCNAAGVMGCRIISSPKERLLAIVTNSLVPCNGRFPALIALAYFIFPGRPFVAAAFLTVMVLLAVFVSLLATGALSKSVLRGECSHFIMEMPPYRKPSLKKIFLSAVRDRVAFVLLRAVMVAVPAGAVIWVLHYVRIDGIPLLLAVSRFLEPVGAFLGMNGVFLLAFFLSFPANELLLPLVIAIVGSQTLAEAGTVAAASALSLSGLSGSAALCVMIFVLFHWPCSTTCLTILKETGSWKWTLLSIALPTVIGVILCVAVRILFN